MNSPTPFRLLPLTAAVLCATTLLAGCNRKDTDDTTTVPPAASTAPAMPAETAPPPSTTAMMPPATTTAMPPGTSTVGMAPGAMSGEPASTMGMATGAVTDTQFYSQALSGSRTEVALSQLAAKQSSNADVKRVADALASDHKAMDKKLETASGGSATPAPADSTLTADLQGKTGTDFDRAYIDRMVSDHQQTIAMFENASKNASSAAARKLATDALPELREHLKSVQDVQQKLGSM